MAETMNNKSINISLDLTFQRIQINTVDIKVVYSHIIPDHVIFLRPSELQPPKRKYDTTAMALFFPVLVEIEKDMNEDKCTQLSLYWRMLS